MELRDLRTFVVVADLLNFNRAGKALHAAQSTVSVRVQALEDELGVRLFDRLGRRVLLTEAGQRLLEYGRKILDMEEEARSWVAGETAGRGALAVRVPETLCATRLTGVLRRFRERFPGVRLRLWPCALESLSDDLRKGVLDLAFVLAYEVVSRDMRSECLGVEELALVAAPGHPLARHTLLGPADLEGVPLLFATSDCSYRRTFEGILVEAGVTPEIAVECGSVAAVEAYVAAGLGLTILPEVAVREACRTGRLVRLPWGDGPLEAAVLMLWHKDKWLSPALAGFMALCRAHLLEEAPPTATASPA